MEFEPEDQDQEDENFSLTWKNIANAILSKVN